MPRSPVLSEIESLDPVRDHQRIVFLTCRQDFPWDTTRALEFALFRSFCVPSISSLLDRTKEFEHRAQKRYDDTDIIVSDDPLIEAFGFPRPSKTLRRIVASGLRTRARLLRLLPRRKRPLLRTEMIHPSYPAGYQVEHLGPPGAPPPP